MQEWEVRGGMKRNLIICITGLSFLIILSLLIYNEMEKVNVVAFDACLRSIHENVQHAVKDETIKLQRIEEWTYIRPEDTKTLEERRVFGDCHQLTSNKLIDIWGEKIQIVYRYQPYFHSAPPSIRVWSKGQDRLAGTTDDIIIPDGPIETLYNLADRWP
ncbi:MAG: hypothetical protein QM785_06200 [Pyrinomonadaceae bacterium]